jgi:hypothetical protein
MESTAQQKPNEQDQIRDLRQELFQDLSKRFSCGLESNASLPLAAQKALVELLDSDVPTAAEIIEAASQNDPSKEEATDE